MSTTATRSATVAVRVSPGARADALTWEDGRGWKVAVAAPPVDGKANERLCAFLAREVLGVAPSRVRVRAGASGRAKVVEVDLPQAEVDAALAAWRAR